MPCPCPSPCRPRPAPRLHPYGAWPTPVCAARLSRASARAIRVHALQRVNITAHSWCRQSWKFAKSQGQSGGCSISGRTGPSFLPYPYEVVYAPAFKGKHGHTESEVEADLARFWNQLQMPVTPLRDEIDRIARTGMGRILDEVVVLVDSEVLSPREYVVREYAIRQLVGPVYFVELSLRLYLRPGLHHAVVLMSEKDSNCTYYLSFTIEMSDSQLLPRWHRCYAPLSALAITSLPVAIPSVGASVGTVAL